MDFRSKYVPDCIRESVSPSITLFLIFSGFVFFFLVIQMDIRHVRRNHLNEVHLGVGRSPLVAFNDSFKRLFSRLVFDPAHFLPKGFARDNLCVLGNLVMCLTLRMGGKLTDLTRERTMNIIQSFQYAHLLTPGEQGISLKKIIQLEKELCPMPRRIIDIWPAAAVFPGGIAINIFSLRKDNQTGSMKLFPIAVSRHSRSLRSHLQIDMLTDSELFRPTNYNMATPNNHVLLIKNLPLLLHRFTSKHTHRNAYRDQYCCRSCGLTTSSFQKVTDHFLICDHKPKLIQGRRKTENKLLHVTHKINPFTNKLERQGLSWNRGHSFMQIRPSLFFYIDFECANIKLDQLDDTGTSHREGLSSNTSAPPNNSEVYLPILSYSYVVTSLYENHPLPASLTAPRFQRINIPENPDPEAAERDFYLSLFLSLRKDLLLAHLHMENVLKNTPPPPPPDKRPAEFQAYYNSIVNCEFCGRRFGSKRWSEKVRII